MAQIETWVAQDLQKPVKVKYLDGNIFSADNEGNIVGVVVTNNGQPATLSGSISGSIIRSDGATVAATGSYSGNRASIVLPEDAYLVPGVVSIIIKDTVGSQVTTLAVVVANVYQSSTDTIVDPGTILPSIANLIAAIDEAVALIPPDYSALTAAVDSIPGTYRISYGILLDTGKWSAVQSGYNYYVPVVPGEVVKTKASNSYSTFIAYLKSVNGMTTGGDADFSASYQSLQRINPGTERYDTVPDDTHYLYIFEAESNYLPVELEISEYNALISMRANTSKLYKRTDFLPQNGIFNAYETTTLTNGYVIGDDGQPVSTQYTSGYAYTDYIPVSFGDMVHLAFVRGADLNGGALYDANHNYIKTIWGTETWTHPSENINADFTFMVNDRNVAYMRYNVQQDNVYMRKKQYIWVARSSAYKALNKTIYVGSGQEFTTIIDAAKYIIDNNIKGATVHVLAGTYNLVTEFGSTFLTNYVNDRYSGIMFGNDAHWIFAEGAYLQFNYDGSNVNVADYFSPLVVAGSCKLENMNIEVTNCQYCIHDDWPDRVSNFIVEYKNCTMKHNGNTVGTYTATVCIGGGLLPEELVIVDGGHYECPSTFNYPISYHSIWANLPATHPSKIIFKNIYLSGGFRLQDADWDCNDVEVIITNCSQGAAIGGTHTFFDITEWNNIIRN